MTFEFRPCRFEIDYDAYVKFLLQHHDELNLPYPFAVKLSFISSPLINGKAALILSEEPYQVVGAAGFVYGTGPNRYEDRHVCQVEVAFLLREYRRTPLFTQALQFLLGEMKAGNPDVEQVQFWASKDETGLERLFSKLNALSGSNRFNVNDLVCHQISYRELETYCRRFESRFKA